MKKEEIYWGLYLLRRNLFENRFRHLLLFIIWFAVFYLIMQIPPTNDAYIILTLLLVFFNFAALHFLVIVSEEKVKEEILKEIPRMEFDYQDEKET